MDGVLRAILEPLLRELLILREIHAAEKERCTAYRRLSKQLKDAAPNGPAVDPRRRRETALEPLPPR